MVEIVLWECSLTQSSDWGEFLSSSQRKGSSHVVEYEKVEKIKERKMGKFFMRRSYQFEVLRGNASLE